MEHGVVQLRVLSGDLEDGICAKPLLLCLARATVFDLAGLHEFIDQARRSGA
jgi:hypothetical protein